MFDTTMNNGIIRESIKLYKVTESPSYTTPSYAYGYQFNYKPTEEDKKKYNERLEEAKKDFPIGSWVKKEYGTEGKVVQHLELQDTSYYSADYKDWNTLKLEIPYTTSRYNRYNDDDNPGYTIKVKHETVSKINEPLKTQKDNDDYSNF